MITKKIFMDETYKNKIPIDEFSCVIVMNEETGLGVEYNYCIESVETDNSAIYPFINEETFYNSSMPYHIDWNDKDWKEKLFNAMCNYLNECQKISLDKLV